MDRLTRYLKETWDLLLEGEVKTSALSKINRLITSNGGEIYVVGGPIRDMVIGVIPKDIDFLVRKLSLESISSLISIIGKSSEVGSSFGIVKGVIDGDEDKDKWFT